jgi:hypothetical protein
MKKIVLKQDKQPDGSVWHVPGKYCHLQPCSQVMLQGEVLDSCEHLHAVGVDMETNEIKWLCSNC